MLDKTSPLPLVFVVAGDGEIRSEIRMMLEADGRSVEDFEDGRAFLSNHRSGHGGCLLIGADLPGLTGLDLLKYLLQHGQMMPVIMTTGNADVRAAVNALKAGAFDVLERPICALELLAAVARALDKSRDCGKLTAQRESAASHVACLTMRQQQILEMVLAGQPSKNIAADLGISQRTVENHRASIMKKTGSRSLPALTRLAIAAAGFATREHELRAG
jgi:two-component system, chemotaxis family, CheB/CheR fusion protein